MSKENALFWSHDLRGVIDNQREKLKEQIGNMQLNQLGPSSFDQACTHLVQKFTIEPLQLLRDQLELIEPREVTAERYSPDWGGTLRRNVLEFRFELPFEGDPELFKCRPSQYYLSPPHADVQTRPNILVFVFQSEDRDGTKIKEALQREIQKVKDFMGFQANDLAQWNASLEPTVRQGMESRRDKLQADQKLVADLGFKVRRRGDAPATVSFPVTRKAMTPMPTPKPGAPVKPSPVLETSDYENILGNLAGMSIPSNVVRAPSPTSARRHYEIGSWSRSTATSEATPRARPSIARAKPTSPSA
jgi:hypothetical protein